MPTLLHILNYAHHGRIPIQYLLWHLHSQQGKMNKHKIVDLMDPRTLHEITHHRTHLLATGGTVIHILLPPPFLAPTKTQGTLASLCIVGEPPWFPIRSWVWSRRPVHGAGDCKGWYGGGGDTVRRYSGCPRWLRKGEEAELCGCKEGVQEEFYRCTCSIWRRIQAGEMDLAWKHRIASRTLLARVRERKGRDTEGDCEDVFWGSCWNEFFSIFFIFYR